MKEPKVTALKKKGAEKAKPHGNKGNKAAQKPDNEKAIAQFRLRMLPERKARWAAQAAKLGLPLSTWLQIVGDAACDAADEARNEAN